VLHVSGLPGPSSGSAAVQNNSYTLLSSPTCETVVSSDNVRTRPRDVRVYTYIYRRERLLYYVVPETDALCLLNIISAVTKGCIVSCIPIKLHLFNCGELFSWLWAKLFSPAIQRGHTYEERRKNNRKYFL